MNDVVASILKLALAGLRGDTAAKVAAIAGIEGLLGDGSPKATNRDPNLDLDMIQSLVVDDPPKAKPPALAVKVLPPPEKAARKADIVTTSTAPAVVETPQDRSSALRAVFDKIAQLYESGRLPSHGWLPANALAEGRYRVMSKTDKNRPDDVILYINLHGVAGTSVRVVSRKNIVDIVRRGDTGAIAERARLYMPDSQQEFEKTIAPDGAVYLERLNREFVGETDDEPT